MASRKMACGLFPDKWICIDALIEAAAASRQIAGKTEAIPTKWKLTLWGRNQASPLALDQRQMLDL